MNNTDTEKWNQIYTSPRKTLPVAARVLSENAHLLQKTGNALDVACGRGANAILLAKHGMDTHAWDISAVALEHLKKNAGQQKLKIKTEQRDIAQHPPVPDSFDVIVVSHFLERKIIPDLIKALRVNGLIFYQTFIKDKTDDAGPKNPDYRLGNNELLNLFKKLHLILYREEGTVGNSKLGFRNEAMLIAQKR